VVGIDLGHVMRAAPPDVSLLGAVGTMQATLFEGTG
jgi:hypothetical protein